MSVNRVNSVNQRRSSGRGKKTIFKGDASIKGENFATLVKTTSQEQLPAAMAIEQLLADLEKKESDLAEWPSQGNFFAYKAGVRQLIQKLLPAGYRIHNLKDRSNRQYEVVRIVDQKLAALFAVVLRRNPDVRFVLRTMGEVRGILLDETR